jgi:hypothetical protein
MPRPGNAPEMPMAKIFAAGSYKGFEANRNGVQLRTMTAQEFAAYMVPD